MSNNILKKILQFSILAILVSFLKLSPTIAATYCIDATDGNDSNDGLSTSSAWKTIAKVNSSSFQPGDYILFKKGEIWREQLNIPSSGIEGNPITFGAYGVGDKPAISGGSERDYAVLIANKRYIVIDGIKCSNSLHGAITIGGISDNITVQNCIMTGSRHGIAIYDNAGGDNIIQNNLIYDLTGNGINANPHTGSTSGSETIIKGNVIYNAFDFGMFCRVNYWIIEDNEIYNCGHNTELGVECVGILIYSASADDDTGRHNVIRRNKINGIVSAGYEGSGIECDRWCNNNKVYYNVCFNNDGPGITLYDAANNEVYGNTCYGNCKNSSGELGKKGEIRLSSSISDLNKNNKVKNNIAYAIRPSVYALYIDSSTSDNEIDLDSNCWYSTNENWYFWNGAGSSNLEKWNGLSVVGADLYTDPNMVNPANENFQLRGSSRCIDAGTNVGITKDFLGNNVPQGVGVDIGAFEYQIIKPPTNIHIIYP